jgi:hypothetical protein
VIVRLRVRRRLGEDLRRAAFALRSISSGEQRVDVVVLEPEQDAVVAPDVGVSPVIAVLGGGFAAPARRGLGNVARPDVLAVAAEKELHRGGTLSSTRAISSSVRP